MGCFTVILYPLGSLSTILITRLLITITITDQDTDSKYFALATVWVSVPYQLNVSITDPEWLIMCLITGNTCERNHCIWPYSMDLLSLKLVKGLEVSILIREADSLNGLIPWPEFKLRFSQLQAQWVLPRSYPTILPYPLPMDGDIQEKCHWVPLLNSEAMPNDPGFNSRTTWLLGLTSWSSGSLDMLVFFIWGCLFRDLAGDNELLAGRDHDFNLCLCISQIALDWVKVKISVSPI